MHLRERSQWLHAVVSLCGEVLLVPMLVLVVMLAAAAHQHFVNRICQLAGGTLV